MKKFKIFNLNILFVCAIASMMFIISSCGKDGEGSENGPEAAFTSTTSGLTATFTNTSLRGESFEWNFGDSNSSTDENPTHTYAADGTYTVSLTVTNDDGTDMTSSSITVEEGTSSGGPLFNFISGKDWVLAREDFVAFHLGPDDGSWDYDPQVVAPWFNLGDLQVDGAFVCQNSLAQRFSAANDVYTFNADGTYNIDWNGDFWGEFGIWAGTAFNEVNIDLVDGNLPVRADGVDVSDFVKTTQNYVIDEAASTLEVIGSGAHISNPRFKSGESSHDVGNGITYTIHRTFTEGDVSYLVLRNVVADNDFDGSVNLHYFTFASYGGTTPEIRPNGNIFVPVDFSDEISSADISHGFDTEGNVGTGVDEVSSSSILEYDQSIDGVACTKYTRTDADGGFTDLKLWSRDADILFDDCGTYTFSKATVDVYVPSTNDFNGALANQLIIKLGDASEDQEFWCCWTTATESDLPLDTWTTVTLDFAGALDDTSVACGVRNDIDLVILEFGGAGHAESGEVYYSDFRFEQ